MEYTSEKIIVEEFINGIKVSDMESLLRSGNDPVILARKAVQSVFEQIFNHGFFHADPHPGNLLIMNGNILAFLDFGMMGTLRAEHLQFLGKYVLGYIRRDPKQMTEALLLLSGKRNFSRFKELEFEVSDMLAHYRFLSVEEMNFGKVMNESVYIIVRNGLRIPPAFYLLIKSLITIERVAATLYPDINFAREMQPYAIELLKRQYSPRKIAEEFFDSIAEYYKLFKEFPSDAASNRVSIAIVVAALIIGASIISQWERTKIVGMFVFVLAGIFGFWLLIKLFRRNKF